MIPMSRSFSLTFPGSPFEWQPFKGREKKTFFAPPNSWNSSLTPIFHAYGIIFGLVFALHPTLGVYIRHHKIHPCYSWCEQIFFSSRHNLSADFVCVFLYKIENTPTKGKEFASFRIKYYSKEEKNWCKRWTRTGMSTCTSTTNSIHSTFYANARMIRMCVFSSCCGCASVDVFHVLHICSSAWTH